MYYIVIFYSNIMFVLSYGLPATIFQLVMHSRMCNENKPFCNDTSSCHNIIFPLYIFIPGQMNGAFIELLLTEVNMKLK